MKENNVPEEVKHQLYKNFFTAGIASMVSRTVICPLERVEILRQLDVSHFKNISVTRSLNLIFKKQGFLGLFKGNSAALSRIFPFSCIEFYSMEFFKNKFLRGEENKHRATNKNYILLCATLTAINAITFTYPLDVVRTRIASNLTDKGLETGFFRSFIHLWSTHGIKGLYKGYYISFVGSMPFIAIKQSIYEILKIIVNQDNLPGYLHTYPSLMHFTYGSVASLIGTTLLYPTYMLKRVLHANSKYLIVNFFFLDDKNFSLNNYLKICYSKYGFRGFYRGLSLSYIKLVPSQGIMFSLNEKLREVLNYK